MHGFQSTILAWMNTAFQFDGKLNYFGVFALVILILLVWFLMKKSGQIDNSNLVDRLQNLKSIGNLSILFIGGGLIAWSIFAPLTSASIARGVVSTDGKNAVVSHLEGGIVRELLVKEGDEVEEGDVLLVLEPVRAEGDLTQMQERLQGLLAIRSRLEAQLIGAEKIDFPPEVTSESLKISQQQIMNRIQEIDEGQRAILHTRKVQLIEENSGISQSIEALKLQKSLFAEEIATAEKMRKSRLLEASKLLTLRRGLAEVDAALASANASKSANESRMSEIELQLLALTQEGERDTNTQLADTEWQILELFSQMPSREDALERTIIRAPIPGKVFNLESALAAGVLKPGENIMEIVPFDTKLIIDAKIRPEDIDRVQVGMDARVILTAYKQRNLPRMNGTLKVVSADRMIEDRTGEPYFLAKVDVDAEELKAIPDVLLIPGMPAEVMVVSGEQTLLWYFVGPFIESFQRSFKDS